MTTYKDGDDISIEKIQSFKTNSVREHRLSISSHIGTHIDAPAHFLQDGATLDQIALETLVGPCRVLDFTNIKEQITEEALIPHTIKTNDRILLKTKNSLLSSTDSFNYSFVYLDETGAHYLAKQKVRCVGIDYLGIERCQPNHKSHIALLSKKIPIIEGLRLEQVEPGNYQLYCLPLLIPGLEGCPARAVLIS